MTPSSASEVEPYWEFVSAALRDAAGERQLVVHWFQTPDDASVNLDEHFGGNERTAKYLRVVVPTLADQLDAQSLWTAVPWELDGRLSQMVLVVARGGQPTVIEARALTPVRAASPTPPWWDLGPDLVAPPKALVEIATQMLI